MKRTSNGLWKLVGEIQGKKVSNPITKLAEQYESTDHLLESLHSKISETTAAHSRDVSEGSQVDFDSRDWEIKIEERTMRNHISKLLTTKASGIDCIPNKIYKSMTNSIAYPLTAILRHLS